MSPQGTSWYWFVLWVARHVVLGFFSGGLRIVGRENVPKEGPVILAPIHVSFFDPPVVSCASPRAVSFMAKEELFKPPVFGRLIRSLGAFPVRRGVVDKSSIRLAIERLKAGGALIMFPEGTRGDGKTMLPLQSGVAILAKRSGAAVVPVGVYGPHKMLPKGAKLPRFSRLKVSFGKPFTWNNVATTGSPHDDRALFAEELTRRIAEQCRIAGLEVRTALKSEGR